MKQNLAKRLLSTTVAIIAAMQCMAATVSVSAADIVSVYKKTDAYSSCNGEQGKDGWYFMYEDSTGAYIDMTWTDNYFKGIGGESVDEHFIVPGYDTPTVVGWEAPYTGTVTLTAQDNTVYRNGPNPEGADVIATMKLNNEILTDDNGKKTQWVFDNTCENGKGNQSYTVTNLHINKGDMIYHEVDCGTNCTGVGIYWKPIITYTEIERDSDPTKREYKKTEAYTGSNGLQGCDGWYYYCKDNGTNELKKLEWSTQFTRFETSGVIIDEHFINPGNNTPAVLAWKAPYSGTVTLTAQDNTVYRNGPNPTGGNVTAVLKLNDEILTADNNQKTQWVFDNTCENGKGNQSYTVTNLHVNKGDILYHEVDCGDNTTGAGIYWKPIITYTDFDSVETEPKVYLINTITDYKNYADIINSTDPQACAKLMADIEWNRNTPQLMNFAGTIDGNNHKITLRGSSLIKSAKGGAVIKNLVLDGVVRGENNVSALIADTTGDTGTITIEKCINLANVEATSDYAAGFVANGVDGVTVNINNSYSNAIVKSGGENVDPLAANKQSIFTNCWYLENGTSKGEEFVNPTVSMAASAEQFASGAVAYGLNAGASDFIFTQIIGTDLNPVVASEDSAKVYRMSTDEYSNSDGAFIAKNGNSTMVCSSKDAQLIFAQYKNDEMTVVNMQSITAGEIIRSDITHNQDTDYYRIFVWENLDNIVPICPHFEYTMQ